MTVEPTTLQLLWFCLIAVLWIGFLVLEGFDYGVGMLIRFLGRNDKEKRVMINTIGPVWDGNEVWLLTAGGATFAAFPGWYATLFSALYLPLFIILVGLIIRGLAFEYRAKRPEQSWKYRWDRGASIGSFVVPFVLGVGFSNFVIGMPVAVARTSATSSSSTSATTSRSPAFHSRSRCAFSLRRFFSLSRSDAAFSKSCASIAPSFSRRTSAMRSSNSRRSGGAVIRRMRNREPASSMRSIALSGS